MTAVTKRNLNGDYKISRQNHRVATTLESTSKERGFITMYMIDILKLHTFVL